MLACIACSKHELEDGGGGVNDNTSNSASNAGNKESVKSLSSQIKDLVLKFSGLQCKGGSGGSTLRSKSLRHHNHGSSYFDDEDDDGGQYTYLRATSSNSTPAWDFTRINNNNEGNRGGPRWIPGIGIPPEDVVLEDDSQPREWMAQVEPGVHITFLSLPGGTGNDLKRIRFSREMFNKWQAQRWWGENYERIMELYNVQRFNRQALPTPPRSEDDDRESFYSRVGSTRESPATPPLTKERQSRNAYRPPPHQATNLAGKVGYVPPVPVPVPDPSEHVLPHYLQSSASTSAAFAGPNVREGLSLDASRTTTSSRDEASISVSNASDIEITEWIEQDEPGVYITIRELSDGTRELRRVRFSRQKFGEGNAKLWWEENRERIQAQYL